MQNREAEILVERMVAVVEHSHQLQLEMLEMWRALLNVGGPTPNSPREPTSKIPAADVLPDKPTPTIAEASALLGVSRDSAYEAVRRVKIRSLRPGHRILIPRSTLMHMFSGAQGHPASNWTEPAPWQVALLAVALGTHDDARRDRVFVPHGAPSIGCRAITTHFRTWAAESTSRRGSFYGATQSLWRPQGGAVISRDPTSTA